MELEEAGYILACSGAVEATWSVAPDATWPVASVAWDVTYFTMAFRTSGPTFWTSGPPFFTASTPRPAPRTTPRIPESAPLDPLGEASRISLGYPPRRRGNGALPRLLHKPDLCDMERSLGGR
jgi:hypothetical protein